MAQLQDPQINGQPQNALRHEKFMDEVAPSIWLGEAKAAKEDNLAILHRHNIKGVVSLGYHEGHWQHRPEPKHLILDIDDSPYAFITDYFSKTFKFIEDVLKNPHHAVLIHCEQGRSRSGAMVIAYLMKKNNQSYPETLNKVLAQRKRVMPNIGFQIQLRAFAKYGWNTETKYSDGVIDIRKEIQRALKNLSVQVSRLQLDIRASEKIFVTFDASKMGSRLVVCQ